MAFQQLRLQAQSYASMCLVHPVLVSLQGSLLRTLVVKASSLVQALRTLQESLLNLAGPRERVHESHQKHCVNEVQKQALSEQ